MKKTLNYILLAVCGLLLFSCANAANNESNPSSNFNFDTSYTVPELPESVGEDPFKENTYSYGSRKIKFGADGTLLVYTGTSQPTHKYEYKYNENTKFLTLRLISWDSNGNGTLRTYNQIIEELKSYRYEDAMDYYQTKEEFEQMMNASYLATKADFEKLTTWKAKISGENMELQENFYTQVPTLPPTITDNMFGFLSEENEGIVTTSIYYTIYHYGNFYYETSNSNSSYTIKDINSDTITAVEVIRQGSGSSSQEIETDNIVHLTYNLSLDNTTGRLTITLTAKDDVSKQLVGTNTYSLTTTDFKTYQKQ